MVMPRKRDARWSKGERFGVERQHRDWIEIRVEGSTRGTLLLRRGMLGLEGHCRKVWHGEWGIVGRNGIVCVG